MWKFQRQRAPSDSEKKRPCRSRLSGNPQTLASEAPVMSRLQASSDAEIPLHRQRFNKQPQKKLEIKPIADKIGELLAGYYRTSTLVIIAAFFYFVVWLLTLAAPPRLFANWLFADSYLLIQLLLFGGNFFLFTYITQNRHVGLWVAAVIWAVLFFHLAHFRLTFPLIFSLVLLAVIWWYLLVFRANRSPTKTDKSVQTDDKNE